VPVLRQVRCVGPQCLPSLIAEVPQQLRPVLLVTLALNCAGRDAIDDANDRAAVPDLCYDGLHGVAGSTVNRGYFADASDIVDNVYRVGPCKENQERMACTYFEDAVFRLRPQAIVVSITSYEARAAGLCECYAEVNSWNRTCHGLVEVFDRLYEPSVPEYCTGRLIFFRW
jgi:hypothetical protein